MAEWAYKLGVIGAGKMGKALVCSLARARALEPGQIVATDVQPAALVALAAACPGAATTGDVADLVASSEILLVAVKPQDFEAAVRPVAGERAAGQLIVSIMAGVRIERIARVLGPDTPIVRVMPNIPCEVAEGAFGYAPNEHVSEAHLALVGDWLNRIGAAERVSEKQLDAVTGLSGSGPAFVALMIEGLADGGVAAGLPRAVAQRLAAQTVLGAGKWVRDMGGPAALKDAVSSPAGTTIEGIRELERQGVRSAALEAVVVASRKASELGQ